MIGLYLEDLEIGRCVDLGSYHFSRDAVLDFARKYDPQPFHVDDAAAARGLFGKLAASGWHTAAAWMKCYVATNEAGRRRLAEAGGTPAPAGPSPGFTNLKWLKPVFPGDTVNYRCTISGKRDLVSRPEWGLLLSLNEGFNQDGELVFSFEGKVLTARHRP